MTEGLLQAFSVVSLSTVKHTLGGVPLAAVYGLSYGEVVLYSAIGGTIGILIFMFLAQGIVSLRQAYFPSKKKKRVFSKKKRFIVKVKRRFGLAGIAFITPWLLSVPIGTMVATGVYRDKKRVFLFMLGSVMLWSFLGGAIAHPLAAALGA